MQSCCRSLARPAQSVADHGEAAVCAHRPFKAGAAILSLIITLALLAPFISNGSPNANSIAIAHSPVVCVSLWHR